MTTHTASVRRSTIDRVPLYRRAFTPAPRRRAPRWLRQALLALGLILLVLVALVSCQESEKPQSLADATLEGPRLVTGPICLEEAVDVSGSMDAFRAQRESAEAALFTFARRFLRRDDLFSTAFFAGAAQVAQPPAALSALTTAPVAPTGLDPSTTVLGPAVDALVAARDARPCAARALIVITDGILRDDRSTLSTALRSGGYARIFAVIPAATGWGRPAELSGGALDSITVHHFADSGLSGRLSSILADAKPLDVVLGEIIGTLTGQQLTQVDGTN